MKHRSSKRAALPINPSENDCLRFHESYMPEPNSGCWLWDGYYGHGNYGSFHMQGKQYRAHRVSYRLHKGPIPHAHEVDHLCKNRYCVNPDHLEAVTYSENIMRSDSPSAVNMRKTHCYKGHHLSTENVRIITRSGGRQYRQCRTCEREHWRSQYRKRKLAKTDQERSAGDTERPASAEGTLTHKIPSPPEEKENGE